MSVSDNPYIVLGVSPNVSAEEIQTAFRKLAKKHHPDLHPGNQKVGEQFARISAAYDILGNPDKRARFDRGEIDASDVEKPAHRLNRDFAASGDDHPYVSTAGFEDFAGGDEILAELLRRGRSTTIRMRGADVHPHLSLDFLEAVNGATKRIVLSNGERLDFTVPAGFQNGQMLRLRGKGEPCLGWCSSWRRSG